MIKTILIIIFILLVGIFTIFDAIVCFFVSMSDELWVRKHSVKVVKNVFKVATFISGVRVYVAGIENLKSLDNEKSYFIISNHRGFFDVITGYLLFDKDTGIVAKDSLAKAPIVSYWMKRIKCLFLNRNDLRDGVKMVLDAIKNINDGISMWVFPEGTRSETNRLGPFHEGVFSIATSAKCPIVVCSFMGTEKIHSNFPKRR